MRPCRLTGSTNGGNPGRRLMRRPRYGLVSRPREALASRPPAKRPAARSSTERWAARGGDEGAVATAPDRGLEHGPCRCPEVLPKGSSRTPQCGAPGGASSRSQGMRRRLTASRAASPAAQGASQAPAFPGAPLPLREPRFGLRDEGLPGADTKNTGGGALPAERDRTRPAAHDEGRPLNAPRPSCRRRGRRPARARSAPPPDAARPP